LARCLPAALAKACIGRLIGDVIDHVSLRGQDWRILEVETARPPSVEQALVIATGSVAYDLPWVR
jgi:hypothetical protein